MVEREKLVGRRDWDSTSGEAAVEVEEKRELRLPPREDSGAVAGCGGGGCCCCCCCCFFSSYHFPNDMIE